MKSVDRMKVDLRTTAYVIVLSLILGTATWSLYRGAISIYYYLFFLLGCGTFIMWNIMNRILFIKKNINELIADAQRAEKKEDWQKANKCYDELIHARPRDLSALLGKARVFKNLSGYRDAIPYIKQILKEFPESPEAHFILGTCYFEGRYTDEAIEHFDTAIDLDPKLLESYVYLGDLYKLNKNYQASAQYYQKFLDKSDDERKKQLVQSKLDGVK